MISQTPRSEAPSSLDAVNVMKSKISMLEVEIEDKKKIIGAMLKVIDQQKAKTAAAEKSAQLIWEHKMTKMKAESDQVCERQLKMCDRLMQDKAQLTAKCSQIAEEFSITKRQFDARVDEVQENASKELQKQRNNWMAQEKMRRDQWEKERVKEIKEMTIKGMEPEFEKILNERKHERRRLEEQYREMNENLRAELNAVTATKVRETREMCQLELEAAVEKERERCREKQREEREQCEKMVTHERSKCAADLLAAERMHSEQRLTDQQRLSEQHTKASEKQEAELEDRIRLLKKKLVAEEEAREEEKKSQQKQWEEREKELEKEYEVRAAAERKKIEEELKEKFQQERNVQIQELVTKFGQQAFEKEKEFRKKLDELTAQMKRDQKRELEMEMANAKVSVTMAQEELEATKEKVAKII